MKTKVLQMDQQNQVSEYQNYQKCVL